jgi:hypothetical protein
MSLIKATINGLGAEIAAVILLAICCKLAHCQLPESPKPHADRLELGLLAADAGIRALDVYSTHQMLANGNRETFLPTAIASRPAAMASLEALDIAGVWFISKRLQAHHHAKLAHLVTMIDFAQDEPWAIHNLTLGKKRNEIRLPPVHRIR